MNNTHEASDKAQAGKKAKLYAELAAEEGAEFIAFQFGVLSGLNECAWKFVKRLVGEAPVLLDARDLQHELICIIAAENARIRQFARNSAQ